jgi:hypothetical protein
MGWRPRRHRRPQRATPRRKALAGIPLTSNPILAFHLSASAISHPRRDATLFEFSPPPRPRASHPAPRAQASHPRASHARASHPGLTPPRHAPQALTPRAARPGPHTPRRAPRPHTPRRAPQALTPRAARPGLTPHAARPTPHTRAPPGENLADPRSWRLIAFWKHKLAKIENGPGEISEITLSSGTGRPPYEPRTHHMGASPASGIRSHQIGPRPQHPGYDSPENGK